MTDEQPPTTRQTLRIEFAVWRGQDGGIRLTPKGGRDFALLEKGFNIRPRTGWESTRVLRAALDAAEQEAGS